MSLLEPTAPVQPPRPRASPPLVRLLAGLADAGYQFVTPSIATHRRVVGRPEKALATSLRDVFGWSLPFHRELIAAELFDALVEADALRQSGLAFRSRLRVSSLGSDLFLHSAFPPNAADAVFFGPDSYRFANFLGEALEDAPKGGVLVDLGAGSGVGGVAAAKLIAPDRTVLVDVNPNALRLARANLVQAGVTAEFRLADGLEDLDGPLDLVVANPPFIAGSGARTYRDGGDLHGARVPLDWATAAAARLRPGGRLLLYSGSAIINGVDPFEAALRARLAHDRFRITYRELDPDIFGGQLSSPAYRDVERIAAVGVSAVRI
jgi:SAM-dependent methyltransferase